MADSPPARRLAIGIDFGTTFSCVAFVNSEGRPVVVKNNDGDFTTPSCVFIGNGEIAVGSTARAKRGSHPDNTFYDIKRLLGRRLREMDNIQWKFRTTSDGKDMSMIKVMTCAEELMYPEEIAALIIHQLKKQVELFERVPVTDAVITVPANFTDPQRHAVMDAGRLAGLNVLRIVNEPTAAAIAYTSQNQSEHNGTEKFVVYDLGGGTFDVSVVQLKGSTNDVLASTGDPRLGGEDFDDELVKYFMREKAEELEGLLSTELEWRIRRACVEAKHRLSEREMTEISVETISKEYQMKSVSLPISRDAFNSLIETSILRTKERVETALKEAKLEKAIEGQNDVHSIILTGGSTRIKRVEEMLNLYFNGIPIKSNIYADQAVAMGAALLANELIKDQSQQVDILKDVTSYSIGVAISNSAFDIVIPKNTKIPCEVSKKYQNAEENQTNILIKVFEGESNLVADNVYLGEINVPVEPKAKGCNKVEEIFKINTNGVLTVTAIDMDTKECIHGQFDKFASREKKFNEIKEANDDRMTRWQENEDRRLQIVRFGERLNQCTRQIGVEEWEKKAKCGELKVWIEGAMNETLHDFTLHFREGNAFLDEQLQDRENVQLNGAHGSIDGLF